MSGPISKNRVVLLQRGTAQQPERQRLQPDEAGLWIRHVFWSRRARSGGLFNPAYAHQRFRRASTCNFGQKNTLTLRYQYYRNNESGEHRLHLAADAVHTSTLDRKHRSDERFAGHQRSHRQRNPLPVSTRHALEDPVSTAPTFNVPGSFSDGGGGGQFSNDHHGSPGTAEHDHHDAGPACHQVRHRLRDNREANSTDANFNGSFSFPSVTAY